MLLELSQIQPDGNIRPVAFASRSLLAHEKKYSKSLFLKELADATQKTQL